MEKEIVVRCKTQKEWDEVQRRMFGRVAWTCWDLYKEDSCISVDNTGYANVAYYKDEGHSFITAQEYLGGKDVKEFEIGDRVECVESVNHIEKGQRGTVVNIGILGLAYIDWDTQHSDNNISCPYARKNHGYNVNFDRIKLIATKPKTTKENNMIELNSSIRTVFVEEDKAAFDLVEKMQKVFGGEIAQNFTGAMILRNNKPEYIAEIKRLDDIEAKRLKEEAKKEGK